MAQSGTDGRGDRVDVGAAILQHLSSGRLRIDGRAMIITPSTRAYLKGAAFGFIAMSIWAGWSAMTRLAVTTSLDAIDVAALRFGVAGILLAPVVVQRGLAVERLGWLGLAVMIVGIGAPYVLVAAGGLRFAPASDQGALNPGCMPLFVAFISAVVLDESIVLARGLGLALIFAGALVIMVWHAFDQNLAWSASRTFGDALFLCAAFLTACFTVVMRRARLDPLHAAALVATGSLVTYLPVYFVLAGMRLAAIPLADLVVQAIFQGILVTIVSIVLYGRSIAMLGASGGAAFGALVPALSALFAIPLLGEWPSETDCFGIILISAGVYLTSGGPLPGSKQRHSRAGRA
jgi:drug/metabolite transporter (DMT)-like permease